MDGSQRPGTNWWLISGIFVAIGAVLIGSAFVVLAASVDASSNHPYASTIDYDVAFYCLVGFGIALIGLSWPFARMVPRVS